VFPNSQQTKGMKRQEDPLDLYLQEVCILLSLLLSIIVYYLLSISLPVITSVPSRIFQIPSTPQLLAYFLYSLRLYHHHEQQQQQQQQQQQ
jgi:hypothetical protein